MEEILIRAGRLAFAFAIAAIGVQQFFYGDFRPVILPAWPIAGHAFWAGLTSAILVAAGLGMMTEKWARRVALLTGGIFLLFFLFGHVLYELLVEKNNIKHLGLWTNALKELALSGGAFAVAGSLPEKGLRIEKESPQAGLLENLIPLGRVFFSITMIAFGLDHFYYPEFVATLVPTWIPGSLFWTYFAGVALMGSGIAIILKIQLKGAALLLGLMLLLWLLMLHIPRAIADPFGDKGNELTSVFEALGFAGIAVVVAFGYKRPQTFLALPR
jgi:uncharacterized membrane protein